MNNSQSKKNLILVLFALLLIFLIVFAISKILTKNTQIPKDVVDSALVQKNDQTVKFDKDGFVELKSPTKSLFQAMSKDKVRNILDYLQKNVRSCTDNQEVYKITFIKDDKQIVLCLDPNDQTLAQIFQIFDVQGFQPSNFFASPTSTPQNQNSGSSQGSTNENNPTPTPVSTIPPDCPLWLLSWCVYPDATPTQPFSPSITPTPTLQLTPTPDCSFWQQFINTQAIISNSFCVKEQ